MKKKKPIKDDFYSILNDEHIPDMQYVHAMKVWNTFILKNMGEYHDLYLTLLDLGGGGGGVELTPPPTGFTR